MEHINQQFFDEYKRLEKACNEIYGQHGVTSYIEKMKKTNKSNSKSIPNWQKTLNQLIRLRHIRNHLAHDEGAFEENLVTKADINWLKDFRKDLLNGNDPLSQLNKKKRNNRLILGFLLILVVLIVIYLVIR